MNAPNRSLTRRLTLGFILVLPTLAAAAWTLQPSAEAALATLTYEAPVMAGADWNDSERVVDLRRRLQRHFLRHDVYIPLEDIVAPGAAPDESLSLIMRRACGQSRLYVWIPFKFRLPIEGEKIVEWCWKPQVSEPKEPGANA